MMQKLFPLIPKEVKRNFHVRLAYFSTLNTYHGIKSKLHYGTSDMWHEMNIETTTTCNRRCSYCPNSTFDRSLPKNQKLMEEWVFKKIIDELAEIKYKDILAPHFYGEPLLDKRLLNFITYAHQKLPRATIKIVSNGDFMSVEKYLALVKAGVRKFIVTQHSPEMSTNMIKLLTFFGKNPKNIPQKNFLKRYEDIGEKTVEVSFDYQILDLFYNRGGLIKLEDVEGYGELDVNPLPICFYHSNPLVITYNGDIPLCCQDYNSEVVFGNVKEQSLMEIWKSPRFTAMRKKLSKRQYDLPMCKTCVGQTT